MMRGLWQHLSRFTIINGQQTKGPLIDGSNDYFAYLGLVPHITKPIGLLRIVAADLSQLRKELEQLKQEPFGKRHVDVNIRLKCIMLDLPKVMARHNQHVHVLSDEIFKVEKRIGIVEKLLAKEMRACLCELNPEQELLDSLTELQTEINELRAKRDLLEEELAQCMYNAPLDEQIEVLFERTQEIYRLYFGYLEPHTPNGKQVHHCFMHEPITRICKTEAYADSNNITVP